MFLLFELAKILDFGKVLPKQRKCDSVKVVLTAWKQSGGRDSLAIYFSNHTLLLWLCCQGDDAVVKELSWLRRPNQGLVSMCYDPTGSWLLCASQDCSLYILPQLSMLCHEASVDRLWKTDDITEIQFTNQRGAVTCSCWWQSLYRQHIACLGTKCGYVLLVNLKSRLLIAEVSVEEYVAQLTVVRDDSLSVTYLLVTTKSNCQWKLLLERQIDTTWPLENNVGGATQQKQTEILSILYRTEETASTFLPRRFHQFASSVLLCPQQAKGRHFIAARDLTTNLYQIYDSNIEHGPLYIYKIPPDTANQVILTDKLLFLTSAVESSNLTVISTQLAETDRDHHQGYKSDSIIQKFVLPPGEEIIAIEKKTFAFDWHQNREAERLSRSQPDGVPSSPTSRHRQTGEDDLDVDEEIVGYSKYGGMIPKTEWSSSPMKKAKVESVEKTVEEVPEEVWCIPVGRHTVLDGCLLITNHAVYVCRPRISPERLFLATVLQGRAVCSGLGVAERLGIVLGLDINKLYRLAAEQLLKGQGDSVHALRLIQCAKAPPIEQARALLRHGVVDKALVILYPLTALKPPVGLSQSQRTLVANMVLRCFLHEMLKIQLEHARNQVVGRNLGTILAIGQMVQLREMEDRFRKFLLTNFSFDAQAALEMLIKYGFTELLLDFAMDRNRVVAALKSIIANSPPPLNSNSAERLPSTGMEPAGGAASRLFSQDRGKRDLALVLHLLQTEDVGRLLVAEAGFMVPLLQYLQQSIPSLGNDGLLQLLQVCDLSLPSLTAHLQKWSQPVLDRVLNSGLDPFKLASTSQVLKFLSRAFATDYITQSCEADTLLQLVQVFVEALIQLNADRPAVKDSLDVSLFTLPADLAEPAEEVAAPVAAAEEKDSLVQRPLLLSCGQNFSALVQHGELNTWGSTQAGRLGIGETSLEREYHPQQVHLFTSLKARVTSVSCGGGHCLAVTDKGVFGWGDSTFGQVGAGTTNVTYNCPVPIGGFGKDTVVQISCGLYHTVALTHNCRVFTWGWGVHGQLGHGNPDDQSSPREVHSLRSSSVVQVAAGFAHTAVCTRQGQVFTFGCGTFGSLGHSGADKSSAPKQVLGIPEPIKFLASKCFHNLAVADSGKLYKWGASPLVLRHTVALVRHARAAGQTTENIPKESHLVPTAVNTTMIKGKIIQVCCGNTFSALLTDRGGVYTAGINSDGQLGTGNRLSEKEFVPVFKLAETKIITIATGSNFIIAMDTSGDLHGWGNNEKGQLAMQPKTPPVLGKKGQSVRLLGRPITRKLAESTGILEPTKLNNRLSNGAIRRTRTLREEVQLVACNEPWWFEEQDDENVDEKGGRPEVALPPLAGPDPGTPYPAQSLLIVLKLLPHLCGADRVLHLCTESQQWKLAAQICLLLNQTLRALRFHLRHLQAVRSGAQSEDHFVTHCQGVLKEYLAVLCEAKTEGNTLQSPDLLPLLEQYCMQVLCFWHEEGLHITALEAFVTESLSLLAVPLFRITIRSGDVGDVEASCEKTHTQDPQSHGSAFVPFDKENKNEELRPSIQSVAATPPGDDATMQRQVTAVSRRLSKSFMLMLTQNVIARSQESEVVQKCLLEVLLCRWLREPQEQQQQQQHRGIEGTLQDIQWSLTKDPVSGASNLYLGKEELASLTKTMKLQSSTPQPSTSQGKTHGQTTREIIPGIISGPSSSSSDATPHSPLRHPENARAFLFTCGHHCTRQSLKNELIPELQTVLNAKKPPLSQTAALLARTYLNGSSCTLGCPKCVLATFQ